jgi:predicted peptidase
MRSRFPMMRVREWRCRWSSPFTRAVSAYATTVACSQEWSSLMKEHTIDRKRVLVVGFSMGGRGTWFMAAHHANLFTAAIPMAASVVDESVEGLGRIPTYIIHSRGDQVVPFAPAERNAQALEKLGRAVKFEALPDLTHYDMRGYVPALGRAVKWIGERW